MFCTNCGQPHPDGDIYCRHCGHLLYAPVARTYVYVQYAGFWRRFAAYIIDSIIINVILYVIGILMGLIVVSSKGNIADLPTLILFIISLAGAVLYFAICESSPAQATAGKLALGIKVTDMEGRRISFGRAVGRYFGKFLCGITLGIGYLMIAFTEKKQGLHDMVAGTLVIKK